MVTAHADIEAPTAAEVYQRLWHSFQRSPLAALGVLMERLRRAF
jgi:hypothetical protein